MRPKASDSERLLLLTLMLESAIGADDWPQVTELLDARSKAIEELGTAPADLVREIGAAEERMLKTLRARLSAVKGDMRNLSAALRIAAPYSRMQPDPSLSMAG